MTAGAPIWLELAAGSDFGLDNLPYAVFPCTSTDGTFLHDGDEVSITASAPGARGGRIHVGDVTGVVEPCRVPPGGASATQLPSYP